MASRILEDLLCGVLGYGIGCNQERSITREECEAITKSWLRNSSLDEVIDAWLQDGNLGDSKFSIIHTLQEKISDIQYMMDDD